jgi:hypothetical protein
VATTDMPTFTIYRRNPAAAVKERIIKVVKSGRQTTTEQKSEMKFQS